MPSYYTPSGVASLHGVSETLPREDCRSGRLPAHPLIGKDGKSSGWVILEADAKAWKPKKGTVGRPRNATK